MNKVDLLYISKISKLFKPFYSGIGHILLFHRVCNENEYNVTRGLQVTQHYLASVIEYFISRKIDIISLDECYNRLVSKARMKRFVVFTFDDGYADNLTHALPVFEKYNAPFAVFIATGYPDYSVILWWYLLDDLVMKNDKIEFEYCNDHYSFSTSTLSEKTDAFWKIRKFILNSNQNDYLPRLSSIFKEEQGDLLALTRKLSLSWDQVKELSKHPLVTIGAHTINHLALSELDENEAIEEISGSMSLIQEKISKPVSYLAYPIGTTAEASLREFDLSKKCNVKMSFTAERGNIFKYHLKHLHSLPRIGINERMRISHIDLYINGLIPFYDKFFR